MHTFMKTGGMLPPAGQRRTLWMYFSLIFVFTFMWLPFIVITFIWGPASPTVDSTWVLWSGAQFSHLQGLATVWAILFKQDIRVAFLGTLTCGKYHEIAETLNSAGRSGSRTNDSTNFNTTRRSNEQSYTYSSNRQQSIASRNFSSVHEILGTLTSHAEYIEEDGKKGSDSDKSKEIEMIILDEVDPALRGLSDLLEEGSRESFPTSIDLVEDVNGADDSSEDTFIDDPVTISAEDIIIEDPTTS